MNLQKIFLYHLIYIFYFLSKKDSNNLLKLKVLIPTLFFLSYQIIENGILKKYLVDKYSTIQMNQESNGCGKRESYEYAPTSRMSNTYLAPGTDSFEEMIKSVKHGIYCKKLSGGQVNTTTGDFNFGVDAAYEIKSGKI